MLYPYLQAARLRAALGRLPPAAGSSPVDQQAADFLAQHGGEPVARLVRAPWLSSLAQRGQWRAFLAAYSGAVGPDQAQRCQALRARIAVGATDGLAAAATAEWLTPASADAACDAIFDWMRAQGLLDAALIERRARLALAAGEAGLARWLARALPEEAAGALREWALLIENPRTAIDALIRSPATVVEESALLDGWTRLARRDPQAASDRFPLLLEARKAGPALASRLAQQVALALAWDRHRGALDYFARIAPGDYDELTHEWHARAALWAGDWPRVARAVAAMPVALRNSARWQYWAARAAAAGGDADLATALFEAVIPSDNWFAVLAAARLERHFAPHPRPAAFDDAALATLERSPEFTRARELFVTGLVPLAQSEWNAGYAALDAPLRHAAVGLAARWGWHFQVIATAAQQALFDDYALLYPRPFDAAVEAATGLVRLPPTLIYAVLRQESLYQPWAVSSAGAVGLMQLLPGTARRTAARLHRSRPSLASLAEPEVSIALGAATLADLLERYDGQVLVALAGYNAGPGAVQRWLPERAMDADVWVENIPYNETRGYVQRIMWHSVVFEWLEHGEALDASSWLGQVRPHG